MDEEGTSVEIDASLPQGMFAPRECVQSGSKGTGHKTGSSPQDEGRAGWGVRSAPVLCSTGQTDGCSRRFPGQQGQGPSPQETHAHAHTPLTSPVQTRGAPPPAPGPKLSLTAPRAHGQRSRPVCSPAPPGSSLLARGGMGSGSRPCLQSSRQALPPPAQDARSVPLQAGIMCHFPGGVVAWKRFAPFAVHTVGT